MMAPSYRLNIIGLNSDRPIHYYFPTQKMAESYAELTLKSNSKVNLKIELYELTETLKLTFEKSQTGNVTVTNNQTIKKEHIKKGE